MFCTSTLNSTLFCSLLPQHDQDVKPQFSRFMDEMRLQFLFRFFLDLIGKVQNCTSLKDINVKEILNTCLAHVISAFGFFIRLFTDLLQFCRFKNSKSCQIISQLTSQLHIQISNLSVSCVSNGAYSPPPFINSSVKYTCIRSSMFLTCYILVPAEKQRIS